MHHHRIGWGLAREFAPECTITESAAPGFVGFEAWAFPLSASGNFLIRKIPVVVVAGDETVADPEFSKAQVRGSHPSKTAKGGAATVIVMSKKNEEPGPALWASPQLGYIQ